MALHRLLWAAILPLLVLAAASSPREVNSGEVVSGFVTEDNLFSHSFTTDVDVLHIGVRSVSGGVVARLATSLDALKLSPKAQYAANKTLTLTHGDELFTGEIFIALEGVGGADFQLSLFSASYLVPGVEVALDSPRHFIAPVCGENVTMSANATYCVRQVGDVTADCAVSGADAFTFAPGDYGLKGHVFIDVFPREPTTLAAPFSALTMVVGQRYDFTSTGNALCVAQVNGTGVLVTDHPLILSVGRKSPVYPNMTGLQGDLIADSSVPSATKIEGPGSISALGSFLPFEPSQTAFSGVVVDSTLLDMGVTTDLAARMYNLTHTAASFVAPLALSTVRPLSGAKPLGMAFIVQTTGETVDRITVALAPESAEELPPSFAVGGEALVTSGKPAESVFGGIVPVHSIPPPYGMSADSVIVGRVTQEAALSYTVTTASIFEVSPDTHVELETEGEAVLLSVSAASVTGLRGLHIDIFFSSPTASVAHISQSHRLPVAGTSEWQYSFGRSARVSVTLTEGDGWDPLKDTSIMLTPESSEVLRLSYVIGEAGSVVFLNEGVAVEATVGTTPSELHAVSLQYTGYDMSRLVALTLSEEDAAALGDACKAFEVEVCLSEPFTSSPPVCDTLNSAGTTYVASDLVATNVVESAMVRLLHCKEPVPFNVTLFTSRYTHHVRPQRRDDQKITVATPDTKDGLGVAVVSYRPEDEEVVVATDGLSSGHYLVCRYPIPIDAPGQRCEPFGAKPFATYTTPTVEDLGAQLWLMVGGESGEVIELRVEYASAALSGQRRSFSGYYSFDRFLIIDHSLPLTPAASVAGRLLGATLHNNYDTQCPVKMCLSSLPQDPTPFSTAECDLGNISVILGDPVSEAAVGVVPDRPILVALAPGECLDTFEVVVGPVLESVDDIVPYEYEPIVGETIYIRNTRAHGTFSAALGVSDPAKFLSLGGTLSTPGTLVMDPSSPSIPSPTAPVAVSSRGLPSLTVTTKEAAVVGLFVTSGCSAFAKSGPQLQFGISEGLVHDLGSEVHSVELGEGEKFSLALLAEHQTKALSVSPCAGSMRLLTSPEPSISGPLVTSYDVSAETIEVTTSVAVNDPINMYAEVNAVTDRAVFEVSPVGRVSLPVPGGRGDVDVTRASSPGLYSVKFTAATAPFGVEALEYAVFSVEKGLTVPNTLCGVLLQGKPLTMDTSSGTPWTLVSDEIAEVALETAVPLAPGSYNLTVAVRSPADGTRASYVVVELVVRDAGMPFLVIMSGVTLMAVVAAAVVWCTVRSRAANRKAGYAPVDRDSDEDLDE